MIDVDRLLREDADRWSASSDFSPPDFNVALCRATRGRRTTQAIAIAGASIAVLIIGVAGFYVARAGGFEGPLALPRQSPSESGTKSRDVVPVPPGVDPWAEGPDGMRLPYAGAVPWGNAVRDVGNSRGITIAANWDGMRSPNLVCSKPVERVTIGTNGQTASIFVAGYALPYKGYCALVGTLAQSIRVALPEGVSLAHVVDAATSMSHTVLDPATAPTASDLPSARFERTVSWNERTRTVTTSYLDGEGGFVRIDSGPRESFEQQVPSYARAASSTFQIGSVTAFVYQGTAGPGYDVYWAPTDANAYAVEVTDKFGEEAVSLEALQSICRSIS